MSIFLPQYFGNTILIFFYSYCPYFPPLREVNASHKFCTIASKINVTPIGVLLAHFEATFDFSRSEFTCP